LTFNEIADGQNIFIDANVFVYHFTGLSKECSNFLLRCETGLLNAFTTVGVVMEVLHRLKRYQPRQSQEQQGNRRI